MSENSNETKPATHNSLGTPMPKMPKVQPSHDVRKWTKWGAIASAVSGFVFGTAMSWSAHSHHQELADNVKDKTPLSAPSEKFAQMTSQQRAELVAKSNARIAKLMGKSVKEMNSAKPEEAPNPNLSSLQIAVGKGADMVGAKSLIDHTGLLDPKQKVGVADPLTTAITLTAMFAALGGWGTRKVAKSLNDKIDNQNARAMQKYENDMRHYVNEEMAHRINMSNATPHPTPTAAQAAQPHPANKKGMGGPG